MDEAFLFYVVLGLILIAELTNGWTDAPNAIATVVSTRVLSPFKAVLMASVFNLFGVLSGTAVAETIGREIVNPELINLETITSSMIAVIVWSSFTAWLGLPTSETHALVAGLGGAGIANAGFHALVWAGWKKVLLGLLFSTLLGFIGGALLMTLLYYLLQNCLPGKVRRSFHFLQMASSALMAFSHGSNDGQKFMGMFTLALVMGGRLSHFAVPLWVMLLCAFIMALGTLIGGWRILKTMGFKITELDTPQGFAAETAAGATIELASFLGVPLSTTHTINTAIMGVGATKRLSAVRWGVTARILMTWVITFPACGLIGYLTSLVMKAFAIL
jgi:PiT family inorganic phosphate transporter